MHVRDCQFQMRIVWSSDADTIQGYSLWNCHKGQQMVYDGSSGMNGRRHNRVRTPHLLLTSKSRMNGRRHDRVRTPHLLLTSKSD